MLRILRREVGFGCPVDGCGRPYLTWHHFDPPWRVREHHDPNGMIALCREHADKADAGAFTPKQLRGLKTDTQRAREIGARFDWMRQRLLAVVGGNFYFDTPTPVQIHGVPVVAFSRDEDGHWLLNVEMPRTTPEPRMIVRENFWISRGEPVELECPPKGRLLAARYANGDAIKIEFIGDMDADKLSDRYPNADTTQWGLRSPVTAVEIEMRLTGTGIEFGPRSTRIGGTVMTNCFTCACTYGLVVS